MNKILILFIGLFLSTFCTVEAQFSSTGSQFYFSFLQNRVDRNGAPTNCLLSEVENSMFIVNNKLIQATVTVDYYGSNINYIVDGVSMVTGPGTNLITIQVQPYDVVEIVIEPTNEISYSDPCNNDNLTTIPDIRDVCLMNNGVIQPKVFHIESSVDITVYAESSQGNSRDASLILPNRALSLDYLATTHFPYPLQYPTVHYGSNVGGPAEIGIVSAHDNTIIHFRFPPTVTATMTAYSNVDSTNCSSLFGDTTHTITLNKGQAYQIQSDQFELTGTEIWSDNYPFAVFSGNMATAIGTASVMGYDHCYEQVYPIENCDDEFVLSPLHTGKNELIKVLATTNGTQVIKDGNLLGVLNKGEWLSFNLESDSSSYLSTYPNKVYLSQFTISSVYTGGTHFKYDPSLVFLPGVHQMIRDISFPVLKEKTGSNPNCTTLNNIKEDYINVIAKSNQINAVYIDDFINTPVPLSQSSHTVVPWTIINSNPDFSYCVLELTNNSTVFPVDYRVFCDNIDADGFICINYGLDCGEAYSFSAGFKIAQNDYNSNQLSLSIFAVINNCITDSSEFMVIPNLYLDSLVWDFDDPGSLNNSSNTIQTNHLFSQAGYYMVSVTGYSDTLIATDVYGLVINESPEINFLSDTIFINSFPYVLDSNVGSSGNTYLWSTGDTTESIIINSNGFYMITVTNTDGCSNIDSVFVYQIGHIGEGFDSGLTVFPNPTSQNVIIENVPEIISRIFIINSLGQRLECYKVNSKQYSFDLSLFTKGIYHIIIELESGNLITRKIVKIED